MSKKITTEEFIEKAKQIHGDKYDYSKVEYINAKNKIIIICSTHNLFLQTPDSHLQGSGCPKCGDKKCSDSKKSNTQDFINKAKKIHGDKYDYSKVDYIGNTNKIIVKCKKHGQFTQQPSNHLLGKGCPKCAIIKRSNKKRKTIEEFIKEAKRIHGDKYDYSKVDYINTDIKVKIKCIVHNYEFEQSPYHHINRKQGCPICAINNKRKTTKEFIEEAKRIHGNKYNYSKVEYITGDSKVIIICNKHGQYIQQPSNHLQGQGCPICANGYTQQYKLHLLNTLENTDLLNMDSIELFIIIGQGNLPTDFGELVSSEPNSDERITTLKELKERFNKEDNIEDVEIIETINNTNNDININNNTNDIVIDNTKDEFKVIDDVDQIITSDIIDIEPKLPTINIIDDLHSLDNTLYASIDEEALQSLIQYKLRKLWNQVLNNQITVESIQNEKGGNYFTQIKLMFFEEYNELLKYKVSDDYSFKYQPNLMQKLTVYRLLKNKSYGNWSGTGAGKTLSFIIASREINAKLTLIIALNSTIKQTKEAIKEVYPQSKIYLDYQNNYVFDRNNNNYLILNYEKFQQEYSEELCQSITNNNIIDFIVVDEVHNVKQRQENNESKRHEIINRLFGRIRENNPNVYTLVMSATPVINELYEAKSLLKLLNGLEYNDLETRRTLPNALKIFQQLILNGLRFLPKYDININELTSHNMSNLNIDGTHLLDKLLLLPKQNYLDAEQLLLEDKLKAITPYLRKGVIIYTYFTTGIVDQVEKYVKSLNLKYGTYTGEESTFIRDENLSNFINGKIDILIGSKPIGTGVDGLQEVCDRMILLTLPWTDSEYTQLKGRIYRQGSIFDNVEFIIPQIKIKLDDNEFWSWDIQRFNLIKNKKTLADAAVDGIIPSKILPTINTMYSKAIESLEKWKNRVNEGQIITSQRNQIYINLYPEIKDVEQRQQRINSELSEFNRRGKIMHSKNMNKEFNDNPESWFRYHALRKERMESWDEIPYEYIATKIKNKNHIIVDFGCGENKFKDCENVKHNKIHSFDHIAIDDTVIACDISNTNLENESIDIAVFSLSLWGTNYKDYIVEAYRILNYGGIIHIAEPAKNYETLEKEQELIKILTEIGFTIVGSIEHRSKFIYITGLKM